MIFARFKNIGGLFAVCVIIPVFLSIVYFGFLATDVYISESRFVVRSPEKPSSGGLGLMLASSGAFSAASEESNAAQAFLESRDALRAVDQGGQFRAAFERPHIWFAERVSALEEGDTFEDLYKYYLKHVKLESDATTSIATLSVRAYTPQDAHRINEQLLRMTEQTVNRMNQRGRADMIRFAEVEVNDAKEQAREAAQALAAYRNREGVVDPELEATAKLEMISKLQDEVITTRAQLAQLREFTPRNPQIPVLANRSRTLDEEIRRQMGSLAGGSNSLAQSSVEFQRLFLENEFAGQQLAVTLASFQEARNEARRQQVYVQRISEPNLPDDPLEPRRTRGVLATLVLGLVAWGIASMLVAGIKEHAQ
ncbi:hypothetical protein [Croceibacterium ferulae]|uniref:hypothetical protein n=1 Tax=Croceibacterium ferulae TaxID=1854641 RepID=UPI000EB4B05E|nr:hypothetical protein [Croceibacterium ferulae]